MITRLQLGLSHLRDHKFKYSFQDCLNPICSCGTEVETTAPYLFQPPNYLYEKKISFGQQRSIFGLNVAGSLSIFPPNSSLSNPITIFVFSFT